jgi:hypothetical protein
MHVRFPKFLAVGVLVCALLVVARPLRAQSLTVSVVSPLPGLTVDGTSSNSGSMTIRTSWNTRGRYYGLVATCLYMNAPLTGTGGNPDTIAAASVRITLPNGTTQSIVGSGDCGIPTSTRITWNSGRSGNANATVGFQVTNLGNLGADTYSGTIYVVALMY